MQIVILIIGLLVMFSVPFIYRLTNPSTLYEDYKVIKWEVNGFLYCDRMTVEKEGKKWNLPISRSVLHLIKVGDVIDFYYNHDEAVNQISLSNK